MKSILRFLRHRATDLLELTINALILLFFGTAVILALIVIGIVMLLICTAWLIPIWAGIFIHPAWMLCDIPILAIYVYFLTKLKA